MLAGILTSANGPSVLVRELLKLAANERSGAVGACSQPTIPLININTKYNPIDRDAKFHFRFTLNTHSVLQVTSWHCLFY